MPTNDIIYRIVAHFLNYPSINGRFGCVTKHNTLTHSQACVNALSTRMSHFCHRFDPIVHITTHRLKVNSITTALNRFKFFELFQRISIDLINVTTDRLQVRK